MGFGGPIPAFAANLKKKRNPEPCRMLDDSVLSYRTWMPKRGKYGNDEAVWYFRFARGKGEISRWLSPRGVAAAAATPARLDIMSALIGSWANEARAALKFGRWTFFGRINMDV